MRKGYDGTLVIRTETGLTIGASTGSDFTSEHEMGSTILMNAMGVRSGREVDVAERMITRIPKEFGADFLEDDTFLLSSDFKRAQYFLRTELEFANRPEPRNIAGAWDAANFALRARGGDIPALRELAAAIVAGEAMFAGLLARNDWRINGVILAIAERVPQALKDNEQHKVESARRLAARAATIKPGLEAALTAKGKRWFALSPEWADKDESDIVFWLNPWEQHRYNSGRFTVDELLAWANDTGPVVKQTVSKTA